MASGSGMSIVLEYMCPKERVLVIFKLIQVPEAQSCELSSTSHVAPCVAIQCCVSRFGPDPHLRLATSLVRVAHVLYSSSNDVALNKL